MSHHASERFLVLKVPLTFTITHPYIYLLKKSHNQTGTFDPCGVLNGCFNLSIYNLF